MMTVELKSLLPELEANSSSGLRRHLETELAAPAAGMPESVSSGEILVRHEADFSAPQESSAAVSSEAPRIAGLLEQLVGLSERNVVSAEKMADLLENQENSSPVFYS